MKNIYINGQKYVSVYHIDVFTRIHSNIMSPMTVDIMEGIVKNNNRNSNSL